MFGIQQTASSPIESPRGGDDEGPGRDDVAIEAPLEIRFAGTPATVMRRPGHDEKLTRGCLFCAASRPYR